jgi:hypothetical protein
MAELYKEGANDKDDRGKICTLRQTGKEEEFQINKEGIFLYERCFDAKCDKRI